MTLAQAPESPDTGSDPILHPFLRATTAAESDRHLRELLEECAAPIMRRVLERKFYATATDTEDVLSSVREELIGQLLLLREGAKPEPIANFRAYVGAVTYGTWAEHLRRTHPARSMLLDRLRYLFENRTRQRGFAIWSGAAGERWCGFESWQTREPMAASPKMQWLLLDPTAAARDTFGAADFKATPLAKLITELFHWLDQPISLPQLVEIIAELLEISDRQESLDFPAAAGESAPNELTDPSPSPVDALKWNEYLRWLWEQSAQLSLAQRCAFLFHSPALREFELCGIGSIRQIAALLELPAEELARIWKEIPLNDFAIGVRLGRERQQVINLRRVARDHLARAWKEWIK